MKKLIALLSVVFFESFAYAAVTPGKTDFVDYCTGANNSNCVFQVDSSGNATGNNVTAQGTLTVTGNSAMTGTVAVTGALTANGTLTSSAKTVLTRATEAGVTISSTIINSASFVIITTTSTAATVTAASTPTISTTTATDGQFVVYKGTSSASTYTFVDNGTLAGSLVELGASTRIVSDLKILGLMYDSTLGKWIEIFYGNN